MGEAYRRLIKRHHPDRTGGDCSRAAEINRAYTQLTRNLRAPQPPRRKVPVPLHVPARRSGRRGAWAAIVLVAAGSAAVMAADSPTFGSDYFAYSAGLSWTGPARPAGFAAVTLTDFDEPLNTVLVDRSIADAVRMYKSGDADATLAFSRSCHNSLRQSPSLAWFDSCAAFDETVAILESDDALAESGPFSATAVIARHLASARILARDTLAADSRVQEIRLRVESTLIPRMDEAAAPTLSL